MCVFYLENIVRLWSPNLKGKLLVLHQNKPWLHVCNSCCCQAPADSVGVISINPRIPLPLAMCRDSIEIRRPLWNRIKTANSSNQSRKDEQNAEVEMERQTLEGLQ